MQKVDLGKEKFSHLSGRDLNLGPFDHGSNALITEEPHAHCSLSKGSVSKSFVNSLKGQIVRQKLITISNTATNQEFPIAENQVFIGQYVRHTGHPA